ncbi:THAP domain-containing protein [Phthorimaea operculella]|nr:THAP domain-containing protein [Phthorimaea operculella]
MASRSPRKFKTKYTCEVIGCRNTTDNCDLTFFSFPKDDKRRDLWLNLVDRENEVITSHARVCEAHFEPHFMIKNAMRSVLKKNAVPKLLLPPKKRQHKAAQATVEFNNAYTQNVVFWRERGVQTPVYLSKQLMSGPKETPKRPKKKDEMNKFNNLCDKLLTQNLSKVVKEQAKYKCNHSGNRYSNDYKIFCLNLYNTSPQAYDLIRETLLNTPSRGTIKRMKTSVIPITTEFNRHIIEVLKNKASSMADKDRHCTLAVGFTNLKTSIFYNIIEDKTVGFHEIDGLQSPEPAQYALVAMIHGIFTNYNQAVGYALLSESKKYQQLSEWTDNLIRKLFAIGLKVRVLVTNMSSDFVNSALERQITMETPYFFIDSHKVFYIYDVSHLMKSVRDNLMSYNFHFGDYVAKWDHIKDFYEKDKTQKPRLAPKLTDSHIKPGNFGKLKVQLAVQHAFCGTKDQINFLNEMIGFFQTVQIICPETGKDVTSEVKFVDGFQVTLNSIIHLFEDLKSEGFSYMATRPLNQDCLENFLGRVHTCYSTKEPTSKQFVSAFRRHVFVPTIHKSKHVICSDDYSATLLEGSNLYIVNEDQKSSSGEQPANAPDDVNDDNVKQQENLNNLIIPMEDYDAENESGGLYRKRAELPEPLPANCQQTIHAACLLLVQACIDRMN